MNRPLFVHSNPQVLERLMKESNSFAMVTTSMVQALQWITNPDVRLSGVFLNPADTTFSAFRFLEITLNHRPALPIFLFESQLNRKMEDAKKVMTNTHIRGVFSGAEPYSSLISSLKEIVESDGAPRTKIPESAHQQGYVTIPISDFFTGTIFPYNVFITDDSGRMALFAQKDSVIDAAYLAKASNQSHFLYVKEEEVQQHKNDVKQAQTNMIDDASIPNSWKTAEMMVSARNVLEEMKNSGINEQLVEYTQTMLGDLFRLISKIEADEGSLFNMIEKAKQCDRSVFCASYAMLICRQLKFEKTATLEILGLASMLQDISLYRGPTGDLSGKLPGELKEEEMKYYLQHPLLSADLVASHTDVPQVTLQVIRQHHERKDKSGFPNRVGGNQLHPMAEILSLINSYYEVTRTHTDDSIMIQELGKSVFPHYAENVVTAFKQVLGSILKDKIHAAAQQQGA